MVLLLFDKHDGVNFFAHCSIACLCAQILYAELIGTCALFFILEGDHLHMLLQQFLPHRSLPSKEELMALSAGVILPTTWMTDLSSLSYIGIFGVLSSFGLTGVVLYEFLNHGLKVRGVKPCLLLSFLNVLHHGMPQTLQSFRVSNSLLAANS